MKLPDLVGIMTLPNAVLFPGSLMPLYIFEPRYRKMLAEALEQERVFAVGLAKRTTKSGERPHSIAGVGLIRTCMAQPDGTSHLVLQGLARVRLTEFYAEHPATGYPMAEIEPLATTGDAEHEQMREVLTEEVKKLARARARVGAKLPKDVVESLVQLPSTDLMMDVVSSTLLDDLAEKQDMLETVDAMERFVKLLGLLKQHRAQFRLWKKVQGPLRNEQVGNN